jgi:outer membrane protein TolC
MAKEKARAEEEARREAERKAREEREAREEAEEEARERAERIAKEKARAEEEARREAERLAEKKQERVEKITDYEKRARGYIARENFDRAEQYIRRIEEMDPGHGSISSLGAMLNRARKEYQEKLIEKKRQEELKKAEELRLEKEREIKKAERKASSFMNRAKKALEDKDYGKARELAYRAREEAPAQTYLESQIAALITTIDKSEMFGTRELKQEQREIEAAQRIETYKRSDPMTQHDEPKTWKERLFDLFRDEEIQDTNEIREGHTYTIDECVQLSLDRSQRLEMADAQVKLAQMRIWESRRDLLPDLDIKLEYTTGKKGSSGLHRHYRGNKYAFEVKHTVWDGFYSWYLVRQNKTNLEIVEFEREKVVNEVVADTKKAYYSLDKNIKALEIQKDFKKKIDRVYEVVDQAYEQELVSKVEFLKIKGKKLQADFQTKSSVEDVSLAKMILFQNLNMEPEKEIFIEPVDPPGEPLQIGLENCYNLALANRPDLKLKEKTIEYYEFERKMMKAKGWPKVEFHGSFGQKYENFEPLYHGNTPGNESPHPDDFAPEVPGGGPVRGDRQLQAEWFAGVKTSIPFWGSTVEHNYVWEKWAPTDLAVRGSRSATNYLTFKILDDMEYFSNLQESKVGFKRSKYEFLKAKKDVIVEVKEQYFTYRKALLQMDVTQAQYEHQKTYVGVMEERQKYGDIDMSALVDEYEKLSEYKYGVVSGHSDYYTALSDLNKSIGVIDHFKPAYEKKEFMAWKENRGKERIADVEKPE